MSQVVLMLCLGLLHFSTLELTIGVDSYVVRTKYGPIQGVTKVARHQTQFIAYYNIPYAKPPIGNLRFEPPVPAEPCKGIYDATILPPICPQIPNGATIYSGKEDCLHVNVYTPLDARPGSNIPVLFYIFGGQFKFGSSTEIGPEFIMNRKIILVTVSSRLGVLGFLSTGDSVLPGNLGLKDQTLAMKWTRENIYDFGGDPRRITLHGHSSGAMCAHAHTFSPLSTDYFDQVIIQSGFITSPRSFWKGDMARDIALKLAKEVNCETDTSELLKACLLQKEAEELVTAAEKFYLWEEVLEPLTFKPVIEDMNFGNAFLSENPAVASYPSPTKPWLLGMTSGEEADTMKTWLRHKDWIFSRNYKIWLAIKTGLIWTCKPDDLEFVLQSAKIRFFKNDGISKSTALNLMELLNGVLFGQALINAIQKYTGVKYLYFWDYRIVGMANTAPYFGSQHGSEIVLIYNKTDEIGLAAEDYEFGEEIITRLVNFAHSGNPNVPFPINTSVYSSWLPVSTPRMEFLHMTTNGSMERDYLWEKHNFWNKIPVFSNYV